MKSITLIISAFVALSGIVGAQEKEAKPAGPSDSAKTAIQKLPRLVDLGASKCVPCKMNTSCKAPALCVALYEKFKTFHLALL